MTTTERTGEERRRALQRMRIEAFRPVCWGYFAMQAVLGVVLWIGVAVSGDARTLLELVPEHPTVTDAFAAADLGVVVVGSAFAAWAVATRRAWAVPVAAFTAGAVVYPTVYLIAWVLATDGPGAGALAIMLFVSPACCWAAWQAWRLDRLDRADPVAG